MPSGASVTAEYDCSRRRKVCYLHVYVYPLPEDFGNSEGLCGNFNGVKADDRTIKGTNDFDNVKEPIKFLKSYM